MHIGAELAIEDEPEWDLTRVHFHPTLKQIYFQCGSITERDLQSVLNLPQLTRLKINKVTQTGPMNDLLSLPELKRFITDDIDVQTSFMYIPRSVELHR